MYIQVNIGRNVGRRPMNGHLWEAFTRQARLTLAAASGAPRVDTHYGHGYWDGLTEESVHLSVYVETDVAPASLDTLRDALAALAHTYGQDAIALVVAESELIGA